MLLAIDTSTRSIGIALYTSEKVLGEWVWESSDFHTVELAPMIARMMEQVSVKPNDLKAIAVATGPGSFTGLRIGLALAKGMALAGQHALIGIPTLDVLVAAQPPTDLPLVAVLQAGRGRLAIRRYRHADGQWKPEGDHQVVNASELASQLRQKTLVCGELTLVDRQILARKRARAVVASAAFSLRRPSFLAELAWRRWIAGDVDEPAALSPQYLHYETPISV